MKQMKKLSALAAGSVAIALLLGTSLAQAEEQVCITEQTVTAIKGLEVTLENLDVIVIDVDFIWTTGFTIYGSNLDNLPFGETAGEEDAFATMGAINKTLTAEQNIPAFAGQDNKNAYYIGAEVETEADAGVGATAGFSGANYQLNDEKWERCEHDLTDNCVGVGSMILAASDHFVYADLKRAVNGATCDGGASPQPPASTTITPGFSGSWFDQTREGEGFNIEIGGSELDAYLLTYFYTYDATGNQMWLTGVADITDSDTVVVDMTVTSGTVFGDNFNPDDVNYDPWGTITFKFSSCNAGTAEYVSDDFGSGTFDLVHITGIAGLTCP
jgi:hypothetical protein